MKTVGVSPRVLGAVALAVCAAIPAAALDSQRFVAGWPVEAGAEAEVFDVPLSADVYAVTSDVEQLAVLDANGTPRSFFKRSAAASSPAQRRVPLDASPLYADGRGGTVATVGVTAAGANVTVTQQGVPARGIVGFVLDARAADIVPSAVELEWRALQQPFLLDVRIEQSTNLTDWRFVGGGAVAALTIGSTQVRHARVPVNAAVGGYLRVTAGAAVADWYLERATLVSATSEPAQRVVARVEPLEMPPRDAPAGALFFDAGARLPVTAVSLDFGSSSDGWVQAEVSTSDALDGPWTPVVYRTLFYAVDFDGRRFASDPQPVVRAARYWRVTPAEAERKPRFALALEYPQEYLRVAGGGAAPYMLAAGTLEPQAGPDAAFASVWAQLPSSTAVAAATLGQRRELGGAAALVAPWSFPWRLAALWAALGGGVLVVGYMAVRLAREMQSKPT